MAGSEIVSLKIEVARHRCEALARETWSLKNREYPSRGSVLLIEFVEKATRAVQDYLQEEADLPDKHLLTEQELEDRVHRVSKLIPFLHSLLGFVEGSDIGATPAPLVLQLRRFARDVVSGSEVVVTARPELNYSITEIASWVREVLLPTPLKDCCGSLPSFLFVVTIPRVESTEVLLHCILSHELGHGLYQSHGLSTRLLPKIKIDQDLVKRLATVIFNQLPGTAPPLVEVELRNSITQQVTGRVSKWVQELCSDGFGIQLFGPAYYFAFIYFSLAFAHLDKESSTHPPPRLRLKLMTLILRRIYPETCFKKKVLEFLDYWEEISQKPVQCRNEIAKIALGGIDTTLVLDAIDHETQQCLGPNKAYGPSRYREDIDTLGPLLTNVIPPGEDVSGGTPKAADMPSILNAGWDLLLSELPTFKANLSRHEADSPYEVRQKLQKLLLKALEIAETKRSWEEMRDADRV